MPLQFISFVILLSLFAFKVSANSTKLKADEILAQVAKTYQQVETYSDTGVVKTLFFTENGKRLDELPFATDFIRNKKFRFEFQTNILFRFRLHTKVSFLVLAMTLSLGETTKLVNIVSESTKKNHSVWQ